MKWHKVEDKPLIKEVGDGYYEILVDDFIIAEMFFPKANETGYYVCRIDDKLQLVDSCGDDIGYGAIDVDRWALFEWPGEEVCN